ncbi:hypothetical protein LI328DRAFT_137913 [Trichoderma asperelloides]|nr:hypothetical protein LI328DRAFT_137913 [Trichoderma asperelloides]
MPYPASLPSWPIRGFVTALLCLYLAYILASTLVQDCNCRDDQDFDNNPPPVSRVEWIQGLHILHRGYLSKLLMGSTSHIGVSLELNAHSRQDLSSPLVLPTTCQYTHSESSLSLL